MSSTNREPCPSCRFLKTLDRLMVGQPDLGWWYPGGCKSGKVVVMSPMAVASLLAADLDIRERSARQLIDRYAAAGYITIHPSGQQMS